jgi:hypothetical protein
MRWKRILIVGLAAAALALSLYAVSLAQAGIRTLQTNENDRAALYGVLHFQTAVLSPSFD